MKILKNESNMTFLWFKITLSGMIHTKARKSPGHSRTFRNILDFTNK